MQTISVKEDSMYNKTKFQANDTINDDFYHRKTDNNSGHPIFEQLKKPVTTIDPDDNSDGRPKVSKYDRNLKKFIEECESISVTIGELTREMDSYRMREEYYSFRNELNEIKRKAIIEAYSRKCLKWKSDFDITN